MCYSKNPKEIADEDEIAAKVYECEHSTQSVLYRLEQELHDVEDGTGLDPPVSSREVMIMPKPAPCWVTMVQDSMEVIVCISEDQHAGRNYPRTADLSMPCPAIGCEGIFV